MEVRVEVETVGGKAENVSGVGDIIRSMSSHFNCPEMSDLELNIDGQTYRVHKFVLGLMSDVFRTMWSRRWEGDLNVLQIQECRECLPVFETFLKFLYGDDIPLDIKTALPLLMLADKYNVVPLKEMFVDYMKKTVKDGSVTGALRWFAYAQVSGHGALQSSCIDVIVNKMDEVANCNEFKFMELDFLASLLERDDLVVLWEKTIYDAVIHWIEQQSEISNDEILLLMKLIRFSMMLPEQLYEIEMSGFYNVHKLIIEPIINMAHRFRSLGKDVHDKSLFSDSTFYPRNYTYKYWCHVMKIDTNGDAFFQTCISASCINHPVLTPPEQVWEIRIAGEKKSSRNSSGNKSLLLPNLGYAPNSSLVTPQSIPLVMTITCLKPIMQDIMVDVVLYQVKKGKLSKFLCQSTVNLPHNEIFSAISRNEGSSDERNVPSASLLQTNLSVGPPKFSPSPMNFAIMFQQLQSTGKHDVTLKHNFTASDFDHPAEIPCFKFNGPTRMTNSIRVAVIFKPRFVSSNSSNDEVESICSDIPTVIEEIYYPPTFSESVDSETSSYED